MLSHLYNNKKYEELVTEDSCEFKVYMSHINKQI